MNEAWTFLAQRPGAFLAMATLLGLLAGSALNVVTCRLPALLKRHWEDEARALLGLAPTVHARCDTWLPASHCPGCDRRLLAWQRIAWLSYLPRRQRCDRCGQPVAGRRASMELGCAALTGVVAWSLGPGEQAVALAVLTWCLLALSVIDARHQVLPDVLVLPMLWLGLIVNALGLFVPLHGALWGAVAGYLSLWTVFWLFKLITGKDGMGHGDFKLLALIGAWGGWQVLPLTLVLSSLLGAVAGLWLLRRPGVVLGTVMPFGPYLAIAGWIAVLWGDEIGASYLQLIGFR
ncbi:prepilin peptidase [Pseudomonas entomophila]|nr:A24 family peptidase [Pseudomonas entomophila]MBA1190104.1 prepilin peptidase [Pseudomonas entomophila]